jgi:tetratricopeptide (TPR) repeat protein
MSKIVLLLVSWLSVLALTGCQPQSARITSLQRKAAASLISEAEFALTIREFVRAEKLLTQASALEFDNGKTWISLGMVRVRLGRKPAAKAAYESALQAYQEAYALEPKSAQLYLQQVYVLALLGRIPEARRVLTEIQQKHGTDPAVRSFVQTRQLDAMVQAPLFKEIAL